MSEGIVRKVQPFTIGTKLSTPAVSKCQDFTQSYLLNKSLDNCKLSHNLNHSVHSLYLSRSQVCSARGPRLVSPPVKQVARPVQSRPQDMAAEDQLNQNILVSSTAVSRSIKKITISGSRENAEETARLPRAKASPTQYSNSNNNNNNNNKITATSTPKPQLPRIVGVSCENKPSSHFKVLLGKDRLAEDHSVREQTGVEVNSANVVQQVSIPRPRSPKSEVKKRESQHSNGSSVVESQTDCFTQRNSLFNKEILQAEAWIRRKLQEFKGSSSSSQCCPLQGCEEAAKTLLRDLKDFDNTLIQLNQMGEQLICKLNPASDLVKTQLSQLREQWQTLKQTATNEARALGGVKNLQEFHKKVDHLEEWIKEKEAEQSLVNVLEENVDKLQLTRRILDLKQDEQLHRNLLEEINHLALKLEKQGKTDGRNISSRRKHINKIWLKVQAHLKNYHENLQLALEVSSFYQQAENTLFAINVVRKSLSECMDPDTYGDREIRDIAGQIMLLDVTVSQLSNLHPALAASVSQKQSEVKDRWAVLQRAFRSDRSAFPPSGSTFPREEDDPLTPVRELQCNVGTGPQRIMGKEVKEEQNRLKGCGTTSNSRSGERTPGSPGAKEQQSTSHAPLPLGDSPARVGDVMLRHHSEGERKPRVEAEPQAFGPRGHPQLHGQLQKFTVSADKTLSWLKDNVGMATQVCSVASFDGLEAARRCQDALEKEIISNRDRIEVVKREGRGLIRAQHPGSRKIETFLRQLEFLWEELRRRHQRNTVFLQASEELGFRVVKVLQGLGSLEAWLESVELSMSHEPSLAGDPKSMSAAERESRLLEREVAARSLELSALKQEVDRLRGQCHPRAEGLPARMAAVERKYQHVQSALTQQSSELQDTRMLTEFLQRVELEEGQELGGGRYSLTQPLSSEITSITALPALPSGGPGEPLIESMGDPVEELREAVEMLNDTVRERGRSQSQDQAVQALLSKHASLAVRVEECLCCSKELNVDILERETDMAVKCEPDRCGLQGLEEQLDQLEIDYEVIRGEVDQTKSQASGLERLCPERAHVLATGTQATLRAWLELGESVAENRKRLQEFIQLKYFFRRYLAMISWTEDTRSCIFSDTALNLGKDGQESVATELDLQIVQKFDEFDELASTGMNLLHRDHHLTEMVRERMEELRSMLGWISVHWRAQKQQWLERKRREESSQDNIYYEAATCSPLTQTPKRDAYLCHQPIKVNACDVDQTAAPGSWLPAVAVGQAEVQDEQHPEDGYEVMNSVGRRGGGPASSANSSILVLREPGAAPLGGAVNLLLSLGNGGDGQVQVLEHPSGTKEKVKEEASEPVHRVSTYLHVKDNNIALNPVYESITLPRQKASASTLAATPSSSSSSSSSSSATSLPPCSPSTATQATGVSFHPAARCGGGSIFSSLKRMGKKRKRKRDTRRHTIQRIMGVEEGGGEPRRACEPAAYDTQTWPLKEGRRTKKSLVKGPGEHAAYMKNPLLMDINSECSGEDSITPYAVSEGAAAHASTGQVRSHCRFLSLGSVLSFELPKDMSLIPSIQDIITIAPPECKKATGAHPDQRPTALSSFKLTPAAPASAPRVRVFGANPETQTDVAKDLPDARETAHSHSHPRPPSLEDADDRTAPRNDLNKTPLRRGIASTQEDTERELDKMSPEISSGTACAHTEGIRLSQISQLPKESAPHVNPAPAPSPTCGHECLSVHTLIQDLDKHIYHRGARLHGEEIYDLQWKQGQSQASHMVVNLKSAVGVGSLNDSVDSGISSSGSFKLCAEASCPDSAQPRGVVGRLMSLEVEAIDCKITRGTNQTSVDLHSPLDPAEVDTEPVHPDHQQFEEEEEELEDIWNNTNSYRRSICSDIMYQPHQEEADIPSGMRGDVLSRTPSSPAKAQAVRYRKLVTVSAPNLLVAELRLPSSIQPLLRDREKTFGELLPPVAKGDRRSWSAFLNGEPARKPPSVVNEMASGPVKLPDMEDNQRYVYQYGEEEEEGDEDVEEEKVGEEEVEECTDSLQDQSVTLLSVHMGPDGVCQTPSGPMTASDISGEMENQERRMATGWHCKTMTGRPELQSMEGTIERKHMLQLGGKKAPSRGWNSYHAVLYRHSLCFYQDRKDTLRSSVCGLPLNLIGAECSPVPEYTKKPNCFCLRLRDGSEYLLNASSRFMMKKWMLKIQANTGRNNSVPSMSLVPVNQGLPVSLNSPVCPGCQSLDKCHCSSRHDIISTFPRRKARGAAQAKEIVVLTREYDHMPQSYQQIAEERCTVSSADAGHRGDNQAAPRRLSGGSRDGSPSLPAQSPVTSGQEWLRNKRRSHSFTSATYQKMKPMILPPAETGGDSGSSYSVTLVIGDRSVDGPPASRGSYPSGSLGMTPYEDHALRSYASLPRPRNKSVFKKFFGKKDGNV